MFFYITESPKIQPFQFPTQIKMGDTASVTCAIMRGTPPFSFRWFKDGILIKSDTSLNTITNNMLSNLVLQTVDEKSTGDYTCEVSSSLGKDNYTAHLTVRGTFNKNYCHI